MRKLIEGVKKFSIFVNENIYYHGTVLPKINQNIDSFKKNTGYRTNPMLDILREVNSPWVFFTTDYDLAYKFGSSKTEGLYHDKNDFSYQTVVLKYEINENKINILDLTTKDYEAELEDIGISLIDLYGIGMYSQDQMWELLDDEEISKTIQSRFDAVKLIENSSGYKGISLAIDINKVNNIIKKI